MITSFGAILKLHFKYFNLFIYKKKNIYSGKKINFLK
jgi:hypothetical protein